MLEVLPTGKYTLGPHLKAFEDEFAAYCECKYAVGVASGTAALHLALEACEIGSGDEVITVANTYVATALAVTYTGATPVFVDVDPRTYNMTAELVAEKITPRTKAVIPVHLYGQPVDMDPLLELAREHNLWVVEDASHAHGARYKDRRVGSLGDIGCFSLYPSKNLGAYGDGGIITTNNREIYEKLLILRYVGQRIKFVHEVIGFQERLDELQAAALSVKLRYLDGWNERRRRWAALYDEILAEAPVVRPYVAPYAYHVYYSYAILVEADERDDLMNFLADHDVGSFAMYPTPVPLLPCYADLGYRPEDIPIAASYADRVVNLPMFPHLREDEVRTAAETVCEFYRQKKS
ncbi:MAG TPA: DegT/DnrJ/EryC1/StrS family aminotransferase [Chloroflexi bacterium]|nr:DegT/DnrJ/EryC1/StrS family aminotransferase [Chloroflexota bacterium]